MRLDRYLVDGGFVESRHRAQHEIKHGRVFINGAVVTKPSATVKSTDTVTLGDPHNPYVSKGGLKLKHALERFNVTLSDTAVLDIGASTGGFTDCALAHGARRVIAVDVGHDQLHPSLKEDPRVEVHENTNFFSFDAARIAEVDRIVIDVSFTSAVPLILHAYRHFNGPIIWLLKPQFEHGFPPKSGVIRHPKDHTAAIKKALNALAEKDIVPHAIIPSPILGGSGNREFLVLLGSGPTTHEIDITAVVNQAHTIKG